MIESTFDIGILIKKLRRSNELRKSKLMSSEETLTVPHTIIMEAPPVERNIQKTAIREKSVKTPPKKQKHTPTPISSPTKQSPSEKEEEEFFENYYEEEYVKGIEIPSETKINVDVPELKLPKRIPVNLKYPLIPKKPKDKKKIKTYTEIKYNSKKNELNYFLVEPNLSEKNKKLLEQVEEILKETLDVDFGELKKSESKKFLEERINKILDYYGFKITEKDKEVLIYYAFRDFIGLGKIEPIMNDSNLEDISCDGTGIPVYVYHRNPIISSVKTNIMFTDNKRLDSFVIKLAQRCGRSISVANPLLDGALPNGSRVQATLGTDIARRGSNFTIRKFTEKPLTPIHLLNYRGISATMLAYLWIAIDKGKSIMIAGPTASGKTTLLNALSLFIRPESKIISIEDTPELRLPHPNWVPEVARSGFGFGGEREGEVTLDDLLKESLRQRPDYIIVGEVRGSEAYVLFQQIATGHPGLSTIHASSIDKVMNRLTTKPIELSPSLIASLDLIIFIGSVRRNQKQVRKVHNIMEIIKYDRNKNVPVTNTVFKWDPITDTFRARKESRLLSKISHETGVAAAKLQGELVRRKKVLEWMKQQGIQEYTQVGKILSYYYQDPKRVMDVVNNA